MNRIALIALAGVAFIGAASSAYAADLIIDEPAAMPGMVESSGGNWDGPYIGVFLGGASGEADHTSLTPGNDLDISGWTLGVNAGANFYLGDSGIIGGVVGDLAWSDISGEDNFGPYGDITHSIDWQGSVRGLLGFDGGAIMPYLTAGVAFAHANRESTGFGGDEADATHVGWTAGAGIAIAATENMSINLEYRYSDFGTQTYDYSGPNDPEVNLTQNAITVGLNWSF